MAEEGRERPLVLVIESVSESMEFPGADYRLVTVSNSSEGLEEALLLCPDLILCVGFEPELLTSLRARGHLDETPIVVVTDRAEERVRLLQSGANDVVAPGLLEELRIRVESLLRSGSASRRLRRILQGLTAQMADANRELDALTYSVSHDLRAPLRAISGFSDVLLSEYGDLLAPEGKSHLLRVCSNARRLSEMLDHLLDRSRLGREPLKRTPLDLTAMVGQIAQQLRTRQPTRAIEVVVADGLSATADARLVTLLWEHLLDNAWKFTAPKSDARIEVGADQGEFFVKDNGVGYEMRYAEKLFSPFQRLHGRDFEGHGIGLATVARIVARHGGKIRAEAALDRGATFFFTLPG